MSRGGHAPHPLNRAFLAPWESHAEVRKLHRDGVQRRDPGGLVSEDSKSGPYPFRHPDVPASGSRIRESTACGEMTVNADASMREEALVAGR